MITRAHEPIPLPLLAGVFLPIATYLSGDSAAAFAAIDYKRPWIAPGVTVDRTG